MLRAVLVVLALAGVLWMHVIASSHDMSAATTKASSAQAAAPGAVHAGSALDVGGSPTAVAAGVAAITVGGERPAAPGGSLTDLCLATVAGLLGVAGFVGLLAAAVARRALLVIPVRQVGRSARRQGPWRPIGPPSLVVLGISRT